VQNAKTHFEQVPVEFAEKVAKEEIARARDSHTSERTWRDIAEEVTKESDSAKMMALVNELDEALEAVRRDKPCTSDGAAPAPGD
jgi:hypothetical protein